jgi:hypothetical protein
MRKHLDLVVLLLCLGLTVGAWQWGVKNDRVAREVLRQEQVVVAKKLDDYLEHLLDYGAAVTGLYAVNGGVTDVDLGKFVHTIMGEDEYSAILRFSLVNVVTLPGQEPQYIVKQVVVKGRLSSLGARFGERTQTTAVDRTSRSDGERGHWLGGQGKLC